MGETNNNTDVESYNLTLQMLGVIESNDWSKLEQIIFKHPSAFQLLSEWITKSSDFYEMSFLHACVRFDPPVRIIKMLIDLCPGSLKSRDCMKRTPLHVAAGTGANVMILELLIQAYPEACQIQDVDGRSPLHLACDTSCSLFEGGDIIKREPPSIEVISTLLAASLSAAVIEDDEGMNAVEYAIFSEASIRVVKLLQRASQSEYRKKQAESRGVRGAPAA
ncbi:hypothetical protein ACHAXS_008861 [Conticribra weissflogii]